MDHLVTGLERWDTLYLAGRMHKPIRVLRDDARVWLAQNENRKSALRTALLLLPEEFTEEELFTQITGLSYRGITNVVFFYDSSSYY